MTDYRIREITPDSVHAELLYPPIIRDLLFARGVETAKDAESFLNPLYETLLDPFLMKDMDKAVDRILSAIEKKEKILIYSDYDADGIPGGVLLRKFFEKIGYTNIENYIPHRHDEGYGLHLEAIETFSENGANLLITVDCGIVDTEQIARAQALDIDVIVTDHHEQNGALPPAYAILNPKQTDCPYPEKVLCGTGVVFKLIQAILSKNRFEMKEGHEKWFLDLVGMATLSDMVPLTGENRTLAYYGLKVLQRSPRPGLMKLWRKLRVDQRFINEDDIGFSLAPRINAASRMGHPMDAFRLLATDDVVEAGEASDHLNRINDERKGVVASLVKEIRKHLHAREENNSLGKVIVLGNPEWKPALLGLAANSIIDDFKRPVFLWGRNGDSIIKGSCRSDGSVNLMVLMEKAKDSLLQFGGHKLAGGFAVSNENIHTLEEVLNNAYEEVKDVYEEEPVWIDKKLNLEDVTFDLYNAVSKLAPFGVGNPKPVFLFESVEVDSVKQFGKEKNHLEISFKKSDEKILKAISFFSKPDSFDVVPEAGRKINLIVTLEKSTFGRYPELRLRIIDII